MEKNVMNSKRWKIFYLVNQNIFDSLKELFEAILDKLYEKKVFSNLDLCIILLQTFGTKKDDNNYLLEEEFKNKELFKKEDLWKSMIMQKINDLIESINIERKDEIGSNEYINYARENIEPIFLSFIFSMKDFNLSDESKKKIIEEVCENEKIKQYKFDVNNLMALSWFNDKLSIIKLYFSFLMYFFLIYKSCKNENN